MRAVFTVVMASIALSTTNYAMAQKSVSPPDFAYPKTVSANAKKALEKALAKNDGEGMLRSLIEYTTAENLITNENFAATASKISEVAENEKRNNLVWYISCAIPVYCMWRKRRY